jgi:uncharacterized lipoprotein YajG
MKFVQSLIIIAAVALFTACDSGPKLVPATPVSKPAPSAQSEQDLHENIALLENTKSMRS